MLRLSDQRWIEAYGLGDPGAVVTKAAVSQDVVVESPHQERHSTRVRARVVLHLVEFGASDDGQFLYVLVGVCPLTECALIALGRCSSHHSSNVELLEDAFDLAPLEVHFTRDHLDREGSLCLVENR